MLSRSDLVITAGLRLKIPATLFSLPKYGMVNFHYSLLPKYRGSLPVFWQKLASDNVYGYSFHRITDQLDAGDIILQKQVDLSSSLGDSEICDQLTRHASQQFHWVLNQVHIGMKQPEVNLPARRFQEYCEYIRISFSQPSNTWHEKSKHSKTLILEDRWWMQMEPTEMSPSSTRSLTPVGTQLLLQLDHYRWVIRKINYLPAVLFYLQFRKFV
jgi:methionyl-tRNA formyltransferase